MTTPSEKIARTQVLFREEQDEVARRTSKLFAWLLLIQWVLAVALAAWVSPYTWAGSNGRVHPHVWAVVLLGGVVISYPVWLTSRRPTWALTRYVVAVAQMLLGAVLIHVTGGRIETHFHVFGSLAFLSAYRDWRTVVVGTVVAAADHILGGLVWPVSTYGVAAGTEWRWAEHAAWVVFEDVFLLIAVRQSVKEMRAAAERRAELEQTNVVIEREVQNRTAELVERTTELRASEGRYRLLFEANPHPMWVAAVADHRFLAVNDAAVLHYGYTRGEFLRMTIRDLDPPGTGDGNGPPDTAPVPGRTDQLRPHRLANGEVRQMDLSAHPINFDGHVAVLVLAIDLTERKVLEGQLKQAQKLESIGQLAAGIAHEINTPIQYIGDNTTFVGEAFRDVCGVLAAYRADPPDPAARTAAEAAADLDYVLEEAPRAIRQTLEGVQHVSRIVKAMKEFAHPGTAEKTPVDLNHAIQTVITVARNEWKYVAEVETDLAADLPPVPGLPGELNQVFLNLLVNAAHAVQAGGGVDAAKGVIRFTTRRSGGMAEVRVSDSGCGIPEAIRERIFDPFFTTKPVGQGTGQGLSIAHAVVEQKHGGVIRFETEVGKGTTFVVRLPIQGERLSHSERILVCETARGPRAAGVLQ